jgi:hypothetical protein
MASRHAIERAIVLGHTIAHEAAHVLLPYYGHSRDGLMRAVWDGPDLVRAAQGRLVFSDEQAALIRATLADGTIGASTAEVNPVSRDGKTIELLALAPRPEPRPSTHTDLGEDFVGALRTGAWGKSQAVGFERAGPRGRDYSSVTAQWLPTDPGQIENPWATTRFPIAASGQSNASA